MLRIVNKYKVWKIVNKYIKYYTNHTDREIPYIPFYKVKIKNKTYCLNKYNNGMYANLIFIAFNNTNDEEVLEDNVKLEVSRYICNEVYRLHYTEVNNNDLPQFIEIRNILK